MLKYLPKIFLFFLWMNPILLFGQLEGLNWIVDLTEEVVEETDLCERCTWVNPTISFVTLAGGEHIFLRYSCSTTESFARMYDLNGNLESECISRNGISECGFGGNAFTIYTFADTILELWNCTTGFDCDFALINGIDRKVPITVDDSRCAEGVKTLQVSNQFQSYEWSGNNIMNNNQANLEIREGGVYSVSVTDEDGCEFDGRVEIPDINKLEVNIKGPAQFCDGTEVELRTANFKSYEWSTGGAAATTFANQAGTYQLTVTNEQDCEGTASFALENFETLPLEIIGDSPEVFEGNPVMVSLSNSTDHNSILTYEWTSNSRVECKTCHETTYFPLIDNELTLTIIDINSCEQQATFAMSVKELPLEVYVPNIFTPNSITGNDHFTIHGSASIERIEALTIFDRWGNQVFTKKDILPNQLSEGWNGRTNGTPAPQDIYIFQSIIVFVNGTEKTISGDFLLLRQ